MYIGIPKAVSTNCVYLCKEAVQSKYCMRNNLFHAAQFELLKIKFETLAEVLRNSRKLKASRCSVAIHKINALATFIKLKTGMGG
jgi:hypothetical protein